MPMTHETPVMYSLPFRAASGETDAAGLCTIGLIQWMQEACNRLLTQFQDMDPDGAQKPVIQPPPVSWLTDPRTIENQLLCYDRNEVLVPLIHAHSFQPVLGDVRVMGYDLAEIEARLARTLFGGKTELHVQIHHYMYSDSKSAPAMLGRLQDTIAQQPLPPHLEKAILSEVDTQHHAAMLIDLLRDCVAFLVAMGASQIRGIDGNTTLKAYALGVLEIPDAVWEEGSSPSIGQHVVLKYVRSLYLKIEEHQTGSATDRIDVRYREPLTNVQRASLSDALGMMDKSALEEALDQFVYGPMQESDAEWGLKECLDVYLGDEEWFIEHFPEDLQLRHAVNTLQTLTQNN